MAKNTNVVTVVGRLGNDVTVAEASLFIGELNLAVGSRTKRGEEWSDKTSWIPVKLIGDRFEKVSEWLTKGVRVAISGRLDQETWETKDGDKRSKIVVVANEVEVIDFPADDDF